MLNQDNSENGVPQLIAGANPAPRGSVVQIFATGGGATVPSLPPGDAAAPSGNPLVVTVIQPVVTIGGVNAPVQFSGMAPGYTGVWQINAQVPPNVAPGNAVPLAVAAGGASSNTVTIAVNVRECLGDPTSTDHARFKYLYPPQIKPFIYKLACLSKRISYLFSLY